MTHQLVFSPGAVINNKYKILEEIGSGYEGRVYAVSEIGTDIERTLKFFYPKRNTKNQTVKAVAKKLHRLRNSHILIQYHTQEKLVLPSGDAVTFLVSEFIEGDMLSDYIANAPGKRLQPFEALHLLHALVVGVEKIHQSGEYHADIHTDNILVEHVGLEFRLKLLDPFHWVGATKRDGQKDDIVNVIEVFYEALGGHKHYSKLPKSIKEICLGMKRPYILRKFKTISRLREHIEMFVWE